MKIKNGVLAFAVFVMGMCFGCGEKLPPGMPKLNPCKITVTMDGKPVSEAMIVLHKTGQSTHDWGTTAFTDASGIAIMKTNGQYKGIPAGKYKICIQKIEVEEREYKGFMEEAKLPPKKRTVIVDLKYDNPEETPFEIEVVDGKRTSLVCEVTAATDPNIPAGFGRPQKRNQF